MTSSDEKSLTVLQQGVLTVQGEFLWGSNYTFLGKVEYQGETLQAVYKPTRGERPLWDFPAATLARREVAAYLVSKYLGWNLVPPTVYRRHGPIGPGSLQLFIEHDPEYHYFNFTERDRQRLRSSALFDVVVNNADRKGSHVLLDKDDHIWLIDHGICFHEEDKLRTVIWDFAGESLPDELCQEMDSFRKLLVESSKVVKELRPYLSQIEINSMISRIERIIAVGHFPNPNPSRRFQPWPPL
ncbi:MAG: SCO1664 family protein [Chloroflexi bacterium]|nr:MAG: SCO1664 family protein [Chloroflexota bacterium]